MFGGNFSSVKRVSRNAVFSSKKIVQNSWSLSPSSGKTYSVGPKSPSPDLDPEIGFTCPFFIISAHFGASTENDMCILGLLLSLFLSFVFNCINIKDPSSHVLDTVTASVTMHSLFSPSFSILTQNHD
jgi:hypothetical protein